MNNVWIYMQIFFVVTPIVLMCSRSMLLSWCNQSLQSVPKEIQQTIKIIKHSSRNSVGVSIQEKLRWADVLFTHLLLNTCYETSGLPNLEWAWVGKEGLGQNRFKIWPYLCFYVCLSIVLKYLLWLAMCTKTTVVDEVEEVVIVVKDWGGGAAAVIAVAVVIVVMVVEVVVMVVVMW